MYIITINQLENDRFLSLITDLVRHGFHFNVTINDVGEWVISFTGGFTGSRFHQ